MNGAPIPFLDLRPGEDASAVDAAIRRVIDRGWYVLGPEVEAFEQEFADACGTPYCVGVGTGTDALALTLRGLGIGRGDEVITTPISATFTALAIQMAGARPVFADVDPERLTLDPAKAEAAITSRTAALLVVHLYGQTADMVSFERIAARHALALVEDCCQAHLATCNGRPVATFGRAGAFSFYPTKNLGALGDAGAVATADRALAERIKRLRNGGQTSRYHHAEPGVNTRLDEIQAAVLRARLPFLRGWTNRRRELAKSYRAGLAQAPVRMLKEMDEGHVYHLFAIRVRQRTKLQEHLKAQGIETLSHYPVPIPRQPALAGERPDPCPVADTACAELLSLPLYPALAASAVARVSEAVSSFSVSGIDDLTNLKSKI